MKTLAAAIVLILFATPALAETIKVRNFEKCKAHMQIATFDRHGVELQQRCYRNFGTCERNRIAMFGLLEHPTALSEGSRQAPVKAVCVRAVPEGK